MTQNTTLIPLNESQPTLVKAEEFVMASYALTVGEARVIFAGLSKVNPNEKITPETEFVINAEEVRQLFYGDKSPGNIYRDLTEACSRLFDREIKIELNEDSHIITRIVSSVGFDRKKKQVVLAFAPKIIPYISNLSSNYTKILLGSTRNFTTYPAFRLYEIFESQIQKGVKTFEMSLVQLRQYLQVEEKYTLFSELRRRIIMPALDQINKFTHFSVEANFEKRQNFSHYDTIIFHISVKRNAKSLTLMKETEKKAKKNKVRSEKQADIDFDGGLL